MGEIILFSALFFFLGFGVASIFAINVHHKHKQAWSRTYRRLMGGIYDATEILGKELIQNNDVIKVRTRILRVKTELFRIYNGE